MSNTIKIDVPENEWTDITSTLTDNVVYTLQNRSQFDLEIMEKSSEPAASDVGLMLAPRQIISIEPKAGFEIYAKTRQSRVYVVITEAA